MKKVVKVVILLLAILAFSSQIFAANLMNQDKIDKIEQYITDNMDKYGVPGMSLVIVQNGEIIYEKGFGVQKLGTDIKVDANTNFCLASVSKSFTALAMLQLRDQGLLELDDPVIKYLPWFATKDKANSDQITINHLIHHISGIPITSYGLEIEHGTEDDLEEQIKKLAQISLFAKPGTTYQYSNLNYWTQALLIEKLTGEKFADYMNDHVFKPLGMERTGYYRYIADLGNLSFGHRVEFGKNKFFDYRVPDVINAAGGLYSNADDLGQYLKAVLAGGIANGNQVLSEESMVEAYTEGFQIRDNIRYGFGWFIREYEGRPFAEHGGDNPNFTADIFILPEDQIGWAILSNSQHSITHVLGGNIGNIINDEELDTINGVAEDGRAQIAGIILYVGFLFGLIGLIWLGFVIVGLIKQKYILTAKLHPARWIVQVFLIPVIGIGALVFGLQLPAQMIGSYRIAKLYQPDLVGSLTITLIIFAAFTVFVAIKAFLRKKPAQKIDVATKRV